MLSHPHPPGIRKPLVFFRPLPHSCSAAGDGRGVAGGGGGSWNNHTTSHGQAGESGNAGCCGTSKGQGGSNGNGGGGQGTCASDGGAGFFTNNNVLTHCGNGAEREAFAYVNGGRGGQNYWCSGAVGGFGGGGGIYRLFCHVSKYLFLDP